MKKKFTSLVLAALIVVALAACGSPDAVEETPTPTPTPTDTPFDLDAYKALVSTCRDDINAASKIINVVGAYQNSYWESMDNFGGKVHSDDLVEHAFNFLSEKTDETRETVDAAYESIRQQYKEIILTEIEGKEAEEIDSTFRNMYDAYSSMYSLVISPSGSRSSFATSIANYKRALSDSNEDLTLFLDE